jgi:AcrR family transcriptional regulator
MAVPQIGISAMTSTKRDAICKAALDLFVERGVDATSTRAIAEQADAAEGTLYRHFEGKDDLVRHLFEESARQFHAVLSEAAGAGSTPREKIARMVRSIFRFADENPQAFSYLLAVDGSLLQRIETTQKPLPMQLFVQVLEEGIDAGDFRPVPPPLATGWIVGMSQRAVVLKPSEFVSTPEEETVDQTVQAALRLLGCTH